MRSHALNRAGRPLRGGFTIVELMVSILIIGVLLAILIVGLRLGARAVRGAAETQSITTLAQAVRLFKQEFGFVPPLLRENYTVTGEARSIEDMLGTEASRQRFAVYDLNNGQHVSFLTRENVPTPPANWGNAGTPTSDLRRFFDPRYSTRVLAYYVVGGCAVPLAPSGSNKTPIDGVPGPGLLAPNRDGSFATKLARDELLTTFDSERGKRIGRKFEAFFSGASSSATLYTDPSDPSRVELRTASGVPYRYYAWKGGKRDPNASGDIVDKLYLELDIPWIVVGPSRTMDRKSKEGKNLDGGTWAIVGAGPNGLFGDEPIDEIGAKLGGVSSASDASEQLRARNIAAEDNIVEVGDDR
ncbi:MAG: type II secretion system protein [Planctomycetota bacterium]|nr:type II secretion system protein [Planctomycetota bacterium]